MMFHTRILFRPKYIFSFARECPIKHVQGSHFSSYRALTGNAGFMQHSYAQPQPSQTRSQSLPSESEWPRIRRLNFRGINWHTCRKMSSYVPKEWKELLSRMQETKMVEKDLVKYFINKDLGYGEFNKFGRINPWCMTDHFEASLCLYNGPVEDSVSLFARNTEMIFKRGMEARLHLDQALKFKVWVSYLGKSTVCWDAQCFDPETDEELASYAIQMVTVDMEKRRPVPLAHRLTNWCPQNLRQAPPEGFDLEFKPEKTFQHAFVVNWSDTDFNSHLNQADITRMCIDCGSFAATQSTLSAFSRELVSYDLKRCSVMYLQEARPGDEVVVECWESEGSPLVLNYALSKKGNFITMVQLEFYAGDSTSKL